MKSPLLLALYIITPLFFFVSCTTTLVPSYIYEESLNLKYPDSDFQKIDLYALKTPAGVETDISALSEYLIEPAVNDWEKIRSIYTWICSNISYDMGVYRGRIDIETKSEDVLNSRSSVCSGYANLFNDLCIQAGLESVVISGFAKGLSYSDGDDVSKANHAWNAVKIDNEWHLFDSTWSSGEVKGFAQNDNYSDYWFNTDPEEFIYSHFPEKDQWQLLDPPVIRNTFTSWPDNVERLYKMGISIENFQEYYNSSDYNGIPRTYYWGQAPIEEAQIPLNPFLSPGESYHFQIKAPHFYGLFLINNDKWIPLIKSGDTYSIDFKPKAGKLILVVKFSGNSYKYIILYKVGNS